MLSGFLKYRGPTFFFFFLFFYFQDTASKRPLFLNIADIQAKCPRTELEKHAFSLKFRTHRQKNVTTRGGGVLGTFFFFWQTIFFASGAHHLYNKCRNEIRNEIMVKQWRKLWSHARSQTYRESGAWGWVQEHTTKQVLSYWNVQKWKLCLWMVFLIFV